MALTHPLLLPLLREVHSTHPPLFADSKTAV
jgi:hypothetical protein